MRTATTGTIHHNFLQDFVGAVKKRSHHVEGQAVAIAGGAGGGGGRVVGRMGTVPC
jgi:hypothetical protein